MQFFAQAKCSFWGVKCNFRGIKCSFWGVAEFVNPFYFKDLEFKKKSQKGFSKGYLKGVYIVLRTHASKPINQKPKNKKASKVVVDLDGSYENRNWLHLVRLRREAKMSEGKTARNLKFWFDWKAGMSERNLSAKYRLSLESVRSLKEVLKLRYQKKEGEG